MIQDDYTRDCIDNKQFSISLNEPKLGVSPTPKIVTYRSRSRYRDANWMP